MHNALGLISEEDDGDTKNGNGPLDADLIIVDEFSMVDMWLAYKFFSRIRKEQSWCLSVTPTSCPVSDPVMFLRK